MATVIGLFDSSREVDSLIEDLTQHGYAKTQIGVVARHEVYQKHFEGVSLTSSTEVGAITGGVTGGLAGLLIGLGALLIPGINLVAAGTFLVAVGATALGLTGGALAGGLVGALSGFGIEEATAQRYAHGVAAGNVLVTVQTSENTIPDVTSYMRQHNALEVDTGMANSSAVALFPSATAPAMTR